MWKNISIASSDLPRDETARYHSGGAARCASERFLVAWRNFIQNHLKQQASTSIYTYEVTLDVISSVYSSTFSIKCIYVYTYSKVCLRLFHIIHAICFRQINSPIVSFEYCTFFGGLEKMNGFGLRKTLSYTASPSFAWIAGTLNI